MNWEEQGVYTTIEPKGQEIVFTVVIRPHNVTRPEDIKLTEYKLTGNLKEKSETVIRAIRNN